MIRRPPRSTLDRSSAASDVYKRQDEEVAVALGGDAEVLVLVRQAVGRGAGKVARQLEPLDHVVHEPFGVGHAFLDENERPSPQVFWHVEVGRGHVEIVLAGRAAVVNGQVVSCLLYTSDAADERSSVDLGGRRILKKQRKHATEASLLHKHTRQQDRHEHYI